MVLAGALTGVALMFKQVAIVNWFFMAALYPVFCRQRKTMVARSLIRRLVGHGLANRVGVGLTLLLEAWWINRLCR
jgi:hypothetical protein